MNTCPNCGQQLTPFNRDVLLCRRCAKEFANEQRTAAIESSAKGVRPPNILISYRPDDCRETARRISARLVARFGRNAVFQDLERTASGVPYPQFLRDTLRRTGAMLVLIGPTWVTAEDRDGRPLLADTKDLVRMEVETALRLGVPLVPIAAPNTEFPTAEELPTALADLAQRGGWAIRSDPDFEHDLDHVVARLEAMLGHVPATVYDASPVAKLETELLRMDHDWQVQRARHDLSTERNPAWWDGMSTVLNYLAGIALVYLGVQCLLSASLPDAAGLVLVTAGVVVPTYMSYKRLAWANARHRYEKRRSDIVARLQAYQRSETP